MYVVILASSLLAALLAFAWLREYRLRGALQALLVRIYSLWSNAHENNGPHRPRDGDSDFHDTGRL